MSRASRRRREQHKSRGARTNRCLADIVRRRDRARDNGVSEAPKLGRGEVCVHQLRGRRAMLAILLKQRVNHRFDHRRELGAKLARASRLVVQDRVSDRDVSAPVERPTAREHFIKHDAKRPEVSAVVDRRRICSGAMYATVPIIARGPVRLTSRGFARPKSSTLTPPVGEQHHVRGLYVAVNDAGGVAAASPRAIDRAMDNASETPSGPSRAIRAASVSPG